MTGQLRAWPQLLVLAAVLGVVHCDSHNNNNNNNDNDSNEGMCGCCGVTDSPLQC